MKYKYIYHDGSFIETEDKMGKDPDKFTCAYESENEQGKKFYYVMSYAGVLYDPLKTGTREYKSFNWKFNMVSFDVYDLYTRYIGINGSDHTKNKAIHNRILLSQAERLI